MRIFLAVLTCFLGLIAPRASFACAVCIELPKASIADHILSADVIVLAGPATENPFRFAVRDVLKGDAQRLESAPEIPFLIDSVTRRALRADPTRMVLFTYGPKYKDSAGRGSSRGWKRIFTMTPERRAFLENLRASGQPWTYGGTESPDRVTFFADYLWHTDQLLHDLALVEIGRAPYEFVRPLGDRFSTDQILREFDILNRFAYRSVAIRLLGLQTDPKARSIVRSRYVRSLNSGGLHSFEWSVAGIEADRGMAIRAIGEVLQNPRRTDTDKEPLIRALAEVGSSRENLRTEIVQVLSNVLENDPQMALPIAIATRSWGETALHQQFGSLALEETDAATQFILNLVLNGPVASD